MSSVAAWGALLTIVSTMDGRGDQRLVQREEWRTVSVGSVLIFRVPRDARDADARAIDSIAGRIDGGHYQITYDYGRFSERVEAYRHCPGYAVSDRRIGSRRTQDASFDDLEGNPRFPFSRLLRVEDGPNALTLRVSCTDRAACTLADAVFDSVEFR
jgi:hypothetical protein